MNVLSRASRFRRHLQYSVDSYFRRIDPGTVSFASPAKPWPYLAWLTLIACLCKQSITFYCQTALIDCYYVRLVKTLLEISLDYIKLQWNRKQWTSAPWRFLFPFTTLPEEPLMFTFHSFIKLTYFCTSNTTFTYFTLLLESKCRIAFLAQFQKLCVWLIE